MSRVRCAVAAVVAALAVIAPGAHGQQRGAPLLAELVEGLGTTGRVLVIGAHPDDEDTNLLSWLARGRNVEAAYLSLTRGDGGQNLIGSELGTALGMIRTEELLAARRIDGARQYFTRAYDFGFSKSAEETYRAWPRDSLLRDMVSVIRAFRPQVIVSVFSGTTRDGHGHHQVAGQLAREAFEAAGDSVRYPARTTSNLPPWSPALFYRSSRSAPGEATFVANAGEYSPVHGRSYAEIAGESRSQHLSQGFGTLQRKGVVPVYLRLDTTRATVATNGAAADIFAGVDTSWGRFADGSLSAATAVALRTIPGAVARVRATLDLKDPATMIEPLGELVTMATGARAALDCPGSPVPTCGGTVGDLAVSLDRLLDLSSRALVEAAGVAIEATSERERVAAGDTVRVTIAVYNRGPASVLVEGGEVRAGGATIPLTTSTPGPGQGAPTPVRPDSVVRWGGVVPIDGVWFPWWLTDGLQGSLYKRYSSTESATLPELVAGEDRLDRTQVRLSLRIGGVPVTAVAAPIVHRVADPARGEVQRPLVGVPRVSVLLGRQVEYARARTPFDRMVPVFLQSASARPETVTVSLVLPMGLRPDSTRRRVVMRPFGRGVAFFRVQGTMRPGLDAIDAIVRGRGVEYGVGYMPVEYQHLRPIQFYREPMTHVQAVDIRIPDELSVAYVQGAGDNVEPMLGQLGIRTTVLDPADLPATDLSKFTTLVIGPRAYGASEALTANAAAVLEFARRGGTVVVQYGQAEMMAPGIMPYPITLNTPSADRVTDEDAAVTVLDSAARVMRWPNVIRGADFGGWIQERGLYMPRTFDSRYTPLLEMHDPGEPPNRGALLVAPLGRGTYIYTTLSFFRQLPAGHPGAARLFVNLLSAGLTQPSPARP